MVDLEALPESELLAAARQGDSAAFERLVSGHRPELYAHCYRMLGSVQDAAEALQEALLGAGKVLLVFEGLDSLRSGLYRESTNACLRLGARRPLRVLSPDYAPARTNTAELGEPVLEPIWLEPWLDAQAPAAAPTTNPAARASSRESLELAFIAALQQLPGTQRAVLLLSEVLEFPATEVAELLDSTVTAVSSTLQRARKTLAERVKGPTQQAELAELGAQGERKLVDDFMRAWQGADLEALLQLLTPDARFIMPPLPAWFDGRENVGRFFAERVLALPSRLVPLRVNGQLGFACYSLPPGASEFRLSALHALRLRGGQIAEIAGFLDSRLHEHLGMPAVLDEANRLSPG